MKDECKVRSNGQPSKSVQAKFRALFFSALVGIVVLEPAPSRADTAGRGVEIRSIQRLADGKVRLFVNAYELEAATRYPITTLDSAAFRFAGTEDAHDVQISSVRTYRDVMPPRKRSVVIAYDNMQSIGAASLRSIKNALLQFLPELRTDFLSVWALGGSQATEIVSMEPDRADTTAAIQKSIIEEAEPQQGRSIATAACRAAETFASWKRKLATPDQRIFVLVTQGNEEAAEPQFRQGEEAPIDKAPVDKAAVDKASADKAAVDAAPVAKALVDGETGCWEMLRSEGVQSFLVTFPAAESLASNPLYGHITQSGGFVHNVGTSLDFMRGLSNLKAYLDSEYVLEFSLPGNGASDERRWQLRVSYHGNVFQSAKFAIPQDVAGELGWAEGFTSPSYPEGPGIRLWGSTRLSGMRLVGVIAAGFGFAVATAILARAWARGRKKFCKTCAHYVDKNFQECVFRRPELRASLFVVSGPQAGMRFPLLKGSNLIGSSPKARVRVAEAKRRHATITLSGRKALLESSDPSGKTSINGWGLSEPRLISTGSIIRIGHSQLRFVAMEDKA